MSIQSLTTSRRSQSTLVPLPFPSFQAHTAFRYVCPNSPHHCLLPKFECVDMLVADVTEISLRRPKAIPEPTGSHPTHFHSTAILKSSDLDRVPSITETCAALPISIHGTGNVIYKDTTRSVFHELDDRDAILTVARDQVVVLKSHDAQYALGVEDLGRYCCLVLIGTSPGSAMIMAHISISHGEEHYMRLLRLMIGIFMKEQELFQLPLVWGIFGRPQKDNVQISLLKDRTTRVFRHLDVKLEITICAPRPAAAMRSPPGRLTVVAVRHEPELPEIYVKDCLSYPRIHSGSLALAFDKLGLRQVDYEYGYDREDSTLGFFSSIFEPPIAKKTE